LSRTLELAALPVLLVTTSRERELPAVLSHAGPTFAIEVGPLPTADALQLAGALVGDEDPTLLARIVRESRGHPLLMDEASRLIGAGTTYELDDAIAHRVSELAPGARDILELVAIAGAPLPYE